MTSDLITFAKLPPWLREATMANEKEGFDHWNPALIRTALVALPVLAYEYRPQEWRVLPLTDEFADVFDGRAGEWVTVEAMIENSLSPSEKHRISEIFSKGTHAPSAVGTIRESVVNVVDKNGATRILRWRARCVEVDQDSHPTRIAGVLIDESEHSRLQNRIQALEKLEAIGRLAGGVAHDFNNLLTAIMGSAELALMSIKRDPIRAQEYLEDVVRAAQRGSELTASLLKVASRPSLDLHPELLSDFLTNSYRLLQRHIGQNHTLALEITPTPIWVAVDRTQMFQIVQNLVVNASDAMPDGGKITISLDVLEQFGRPWAQLTVSDHGHGIDEGVVERVFEPFFTTKKNGSGLGLAIVHSVVTRLGGHIDITSKSGEGTAIHVMLPGYFSNESAQEGIAAS